MEIKNNFTSSVTLGSFNPAILTPEFIREQEIWDETEIEKSNKTPVFSELTFPNASFLVELERFQVISRDPENFGDPGIVRAACQYVEILQYTPVFVQGINFNIDLIDFYDNEKLQSLFDDPEKGFSNLIHGFNQLLLDKKMSISQSKREVVSFNCKYSINDYSSVSISFQKQGERIRINYNFEVTEIDKNKDRLNFICRNYENIHEGFVNFEKQLKGE